MAVTGHLYLLFTLRFLKIKLVLSLLLSLYLTVLYAAFLQELVVHVIR
jgi:hypothetical protein